MASFQSVSRNVPSGYAVGNSMAICNAATGETIENYNAANLDEDFIGAGHSAIPSNGSPSVGYPWVKRIQKTGGSPAVGAVSNFAGGAVQLAIDSTSEKQEASLYANDVLNWDVTKTPLWEAVLAPTVLPNAAQVEMVWGLRSAWVDGPDNASFYLDFQLLGSGVITCRSKDGVTNPTSATGVTLVAGAFHTFRIDAFDPTNVLFWIDNVPVNQSKVSFAATGASAILQPYVSIYKASGIGVGTLQVDKVQLGVNRS